MDMTFEEPPIGVKESLGEVDSDLLFCAAEPGRDAPESGRETLEARRKAGVTFEPKLESQRLEESAPLWGLEPALRDISGTLSKTAWPFPEKPPARGKGTATASALINSET